MYKIDNHQDLPYSTQNYTQHFITNYKEKESGKE